MFLVVFKKQEGEIKNAYSVVDDVNLRHIPAEIILNKKQVAKDYSLVTPKEEIEKEVELLSV